MKKLRKISLRDLGQVEMQKKMMGMLKGGLERSCDCIYQWLCPSPSNYELVIGQPNLCHIK